MKKVWRFLFLANFIFVDLFGEISEKITGEEKLSVWTDLGLKTLHEYTTPAFLTGAEGSGVVFPDPIIDYEVFDKIVENFTEHEKAFLTRSDEVWIGKYIPLLLFDDVHGFIQALCVDYSTTLVVLGDIHGSIHSLLRILGQLVSLGIVDDNYTLAASCRLIFLGDYADRGRYGVEVWYTILRLKMANPDQVFLIRGNHEMIKLARMYGFMNEIKEKYNIRDRCLRRDIEDVLRDLFNVLPSAFFIGCGEDDVNFLQFCHGGLGALYNQDIHSLVKMHVEPLLDDVAYHHRLVVTNFYLDQYPLINSFMWGDFFTTLEDFANLPDSCKHGSIVFSRGGPSTAAIAGSLVRPYLFNGSFLNLKYSVSAIIRGHQHITGVHQLSTKVLGESWEPVFSGQETVCAPSDTDVYPVFTIISGAEGMGLIGEGFALIRFNKENNTWMLTSYFSC